MANFVQTNRTLQPEQTPGRRPIVLARIPHASANDVRNTLPFEETGNTKLPMVDRPSISDPPPPPVIHTPAPPKIHSPDASLTDNFVDHRHVASNAPPAPKGPSKQTRSERSSRSVAKSHASQSHRKRSRSTRPTPSPGQTVLPAPEANGLYKLHSQIAPYAGVIVALALLLSAGLLYWIIAAPNRMPTDSRDKDFESFEANSQELPNFAPSLPSPSSDDFSIDESEALVEDLPYWETEGAEIDEPQTVIEEPLPPLPLVEVEELPAEASLARKNTQATAPEAATNQVATQHTKPDSEPPIALVFPSTDHPEDLDFSKFHVPAVDKKQSVPVPSRPAIEMGRRPLSRILTPSKG